MRRPSYLNAAWCCPHGYQFGNDDGMPMDHASDGCRYPVDDEVELLRARADVIAHALNLIDRAKSRRDTPQMRGLIKLVGEVATTMTIAELRDQRDDLRRRIREDATP